MKNFSKDANSCIQLDCTFNKHLPNISLEAELLLCN